MSGKAEVVDAIANEAGLSKKDATAALEAAINSIAGSLKRNERVALPGLGVFNVGERKARSGINPQTKAAIRIPASKVAKFRAGKDLKELLNRKKK
jgi:DNA-binding protein HU-beta